jgi:hypothetical protein
LTRTQQAVVSPEPVYSLTRQERPGDNPQRSAAMSKGMDSKKQGKKEPAKTMKEKRAAKKAKKEGKGGLR